MPSKEQITEKIAALQDSSGATWKDRPYDEDEAWVGEEYNIKFQVTKNGREAETIWLFLQGRSPIGKRKLLEDFIVALGEPSFGKLTNLPKQKFFYWTKDDRLAKLGQLLSEELGELKPADPRND